MQNYSQAFADALAAFQSPLVPADQGDNGKGQVTARAIYTINTTMNPNFGHIGKNPGQTQYPTPAVDGLRGIAVDAGFDRMTGEGADYLTDVDAGNGQREIRLAYTPYATPPPGTPVDTSNWVQPSTQYRDLAGPLVLKADSGGGTPEPPTPLPPPADYTEVLAALDEIGAVLATMQVQQQTDTQAIIANDNANTEKSMQQIRDLVEDVEESLIEIALLLLIVKRPDSETAATAAVGTVREKMHARRDARRTRRADRHATGN